LDICFVESFPQRRGLQLLPGVSNGGGVSTQLEPLQRAAPPTITHTDLNTVLESFS